MTSPTLLGMPENVLFQILGYSSFRSIQCLRKVCKPLRSFIDETEPPANLKFLEISIFDKRYILKCENLKRKGIELEYFPKKNGCFVNYIFKSLFLKNQNFSEVFLQDVKLISKFQKSILAKLTINWEYNDSRVLENLKGIFKTRVFEVKFSRFLETSKILEIVDPTFLKFLKIQTPNSRDHSNLERIDDVLEKCGNLEKLESENFKISIDFRNIRNLKFAKIFVERMTLDDLEVLKEIFSNSSTPKKISIRIEKSEHMVDQISHIFGSPTFSRRSYWEYCNSSNLKFSIWCTFSLYYNKNYLLCDFEVETER